MPALYRYLTSDPQPFPGESKPLYLTRRDLRCALAQTVQELFPEWWASMDLAEHRRNMRLAQGQNREVLLAAAIRTDVGRRLVARSLLGL